MIARHISGPANDSVLIEDAWAQARIDEGELEPGSMLASMVTVAREHMERGLNVAIGEQVYKLTMECWPTEARFELLPAPLVSVESITYYDEDDIEQTLATTVYRAHTHLRPGFVELQEDEEWPALKARADAVSINFTAGYGGAAWPVPETLKRAMLMLFTAQYAMRGDDERADNRVSIWDEALRICSNCKVVRY